MAFITVQLQNEIEGNFTLSYATGEVSNGASGMYMYNGKSLFMLLHIHVIYRG